MENSSRENEKYYDCLVVVTISGMCVSLALAIVYWLLHPDDVGWQFFLSMIFVFFGLYSVKNEFSFNSVMTWLGIFSTIVVWWLTLPGIYYAIKYGLGFI